MQEKELLILLENDSDAGMRRLIQMYAGLVMSVVRAKLPPHLFCDADIEDCVAQTFSEFYCDLDNYTPDKGSIRSLLCVMARNNAADILRRRYKEHQNVSIDDESCDWCEEFLSYDGGFEDAELKQALTAAILQLGEPDKEIIIRKFYLGESSKTIAKKVSLTVSNVDTRAHRALAKLRSILGGNE